MLNAFIDHLSGLVKLLDAHQGSCMVFLTVALAICAAISCLISAKNIRLVKALETKRSNPYLILEATQKLPMYGIRLSNVGMTAARNVHVESDPELKILLPKFGKTIGFLNPGVPFLVPGGSQATILGSFKDIKDGNPSLKYKCKIHYESDSGEQFCTECELDFSLFEGLAYHSQKTLTDIDRRFEDLVREIHLIGSGFNNPHVLTETFAEHRARIEKELEEVQEPLLDPSLCDAMFDALNNTNVFKFDEKLRQMHSQVCATLDRLRHATAWINSHPIMPSGHERPTGLMTFMMFASLVKTSIENLRKAFGLNATIFDSGHADSRKYFSDVCCSEPLNIPADKCPIDDAFFQYFRSLVFAHSDKVEESKGVLLPREVQFSPYIVEKSLTRGEPDSDDYVGVMIYSTDKKRDWKELRVRFSALKAYLKSRYESLGLVLKMINRKIREAEKSWRNTKVDRTLSPLDQLKFMKAEFDKRFEYCLSLEVQELISCLEAPCSLEKNRARVESFRHQIVDAVSRLADCFESLDSDTFVRVADRFTNEQVDGDKKINYVLRQISENLHKPEMRSLAVQDIKTASDHFAGRWVEINPFIMPDEEIEMLLAVACFFQSGRNRPMSEESEGQNPQLQPRDEDTKQNMPMKGEPS